MALINFYKSGNVWIIKKNTIPAGNYIKNEDDSGVITIFKDKETLALGNYFDFCDIDGNAYSSLTAFNTATNDFFVKASSDGGVPTDYTDEKDARLTSTKLLLDVSAENRLLTNQFTSWPLSRDAECLSPEFTFAEYRRFFVDAYVTFTRNSGYNYSFSTIKRNVAGVWQITVTGEVPVTFGSPVTTVVSAEFSTTVNPENGSYITIHELKSSNVVVGKVAVRWDTLTTGKNLTNLWASGDFKYTLSRELFDKEFSWYIRPQERLVEAKAYTDAAIAAHLIG